MAAEVGFGWHWVFTCGVDVVVFWRRTWEVSCSSPALKRTTTTGRLVWQLPALALGRVPSLGVVELFLDDDLRRPIQSKLDWAKMGVFSAFDH